MGGRGGARGMAGGARGAAAEAGCDAALGAWWVPDAAADACPLFAAVRATLVREDELGEEGGLARPIAREAEVRATVARLLRGHLAGYACTAEEVVLPC